MLGSIHQVVARIRAVFRSSEFDRDLEMELESHVELLAEEYVRRGATQEVAR